MVIYIVFVEFYNQYDDLIIKILNDENSILYSKDIKIENICQKNSYYKTAYFIIEKLKISSKIIAFFIDYFYSINGIWFIDKFNLHLNF